MPARSLRRFGRRELLRLLGGVSAGLAVPPVLGSGRAGAAPMAKWECTNDQCEPFVYDPAIGVPDFDIPPGIAFEDLPEDWVCPICGNAKWEFEPLA